MPTKLGQVSDIRWDKAQAPAVAGQDIVWDGGVAEQAPAAAPAKATQVQETLSPLLSAARLGNSLLVQPATQGVAGLAGLLSGEDPQQWRDIVGEATQFPGNPATDELEANASRALAPVRTATAVAGATPQARLFKRALAVLPEGAQKALGLGAGAALDVAGLVPVAGVASSGVRSLTRAAARFTPNAMAGRMATEVARDMAGPSRSAIVQSLRSAAPGETAGQAAAGIDQPGWQALQKFAEHNDTSGGLYRVRKAQEAERQAALAAQTPDETAAREARSTAADPLYTEARKRNVPLAPGSDAADVLGRMPPEAVAEARRRAHINGTDVFQYDANGRPIALNGDSIQTLKDVLSDLSYAGPTATGAERASARTVANYLPQYLGVVEQAVPEYGQARAVFRELSPPVNQSQVMQQLSQDLQSAHGGESASPFLTGVNKAPDRVLKRATGDARYAGQPLEKVLAPEQMQAVQNVAGQLEREDTMRRQATAGSGGLSRTLNARHAHSRIPAFFSRVTTAANKGLEMAETQINRRLLDKLVEGMRSGESADKLLAGMPPDDRAKLVSWLNSQTTAAAAATPQLRTN